MLTFLWLSSSMSLLVQMYRLWNRELGDVYADMKTNSHAHYFLLKYENYF